MSERTGRRVTAGLLVLAMATTALWLRSFWVADIWQKGTWVSAARRYDTDLFESVPGRIRWARGGMVFANQQLVDVYESNAQRIRVPVWEYGSMMVRAGQRGGWYRPSWRRTSRTTADWTQGGLVLDVPYWPVIAAAWWVGAVRWRRQRTQRDWKRAGRCQTCGYDVRASGTRCPECGKPTAPVAQPASADVDSSAR